MNLILFRPQELTRPLPGKDPRAVHVTRVLRAHVGDSLRAGVVDGNSGSAIIRSIDAETGAVELDFDLPDPPLPPHPLTIIVGHPRPIVIRRLLKDLTTLGVERIWFVGTDLGERSYQDTRMWETEDWTRYLVEGAEQARTTVLPVVERFAGANAVIEATFSAGPMNRVFLDNVEGLPGAQRLSYPEASSILAIGSERGWSDRERDAFMSAGFTPAVIGSRTLRTETACTAGITLVLAGMGLI